MKRVEPPRVVPKSIFHGEVEPTCVLWKRIDADTGNAEFFIWPRDIPIVRVMERGKQGDAVFPVEDGADPDRLISYARKARRGK